jgi:competence CoiA-like predicted nuclease
MLRYFLDVELHHQYHNSNDLKRNFDISMIALLASPNHGISVSSSVFRDSKKGTQFKKHDKNIFQEINAETSFREKIKNKFQSNVLSELYYDSKLMYTLNYDVSSNLWPEIPIYNLIATDDIIVNNGSANFHPNEIVYHKNFHQQEFKSVHMKNPFEWRELTDFLDLKELKKIKINLEERIPGLKYFTMKPIYQNLNIIKYLKDQLNLL